MKNNLLKWLNKNRFLDLNQLQWAVPLFLSVTAFIFEFIEHGLEDGLNFDLAFISETIIFGLMGPVIIGFIIAWMRELVNAEKKAIAEVQVLNRELEGKVAERTTALEERNIELAQANHDLQHLDQMKSEFVSLVSHELRAPLTTLNGGLELAMQNAETLPPLARRTLETMVGESTRLTQLVQTILDVSRLEAGKLDINIGPVALRPLMEQAAEVILVPTGRPLEWKFSPDLPPVLADEIHLEAIIRNLLRNADKYSPADTPIQLCACQEENQVRISIKDHGSGVPKEHQQYIFERFVRVQSGESAPPGWGLGLYFARKLILAQHGSIGMISPIWPDPKAPGSEFYLVVPVENSSED
jgi:signal transduction histidine kinase